MSHHVASVLRSGVFGLEAHGILAPQPGIAPTTPTLEGEGLTTGAPGKALEGIFVVVVQSLSRTQDSFETPMDRSTPGTNVVKSPQ